MAGESEIRINTAVNTDPISKGLVDAVRAATPAMQKLTLQFQQQAISIKKQSDSISEMKDKLSGITDDAAAAKLAKDIETASLKLELTQARATVLRDRLMEIHDLRPITDEQFPVDTIDASTAAIERMLQRERDLVGVNLTGDDFKAVADSADDAAESISFVKYNSEQVQEEMNEISKSMEQASKAVKVTENNTKNVSNNVKIINKDTKTAGNSANTTAGMFEKMANRIKRLVVAAFVFNVIRRGLTELRESLGGMLMTNDQFVNSLNSIKVNLAVAFQPIYQYVLPALLKLMEFLSTASAYIATFISALFGQTYEQSKAAAEALNEQADALKNLKKEAKGVIAPFDKINKLSEQTEASDFSKLFAQIETPKIETTFLDAFLAALQPVRDALAGLWEQLKVFGSFAWEGLKGFYDNFLVPVGNWILGTGLPRFIDGITYLFSQVDWARLNGAVNELWKALSHFAIHVGEGLLWFYENVLVPIGIWAMSDLAPAAIKLLASAIKTLDIVIQAMKPFAIWLWDSFLQPIGKWAGETIIKLIESLTKVFTAFSEWASKNQNTVDLIVSSVLGFFAGLLLYAGMAKIITWIETLGTALATFGSKGMIAAIGAAAPAIAIGLLVGAIAAVASVWGKLSAGEKVLAALGVAALAAAAAIAIFHTSWTAGLAAVAIIAGIAGIAAVFAALKGQIGSMSSGLMTSISGASLTGGMSMPSSASAMMRTLSSSPPLPKLATGGIVSRATQATIGENGREAVLPLDRNTDWMDALAEKIGQYVLSIIPAQSQGNQKAQLILDGRVVGELLWPYTKQNILDIGVSMSSGGIF